MMIWIRTRCNIRHGVLYYSGLTLTPCPLTPFFLYCASSSVSISSISLSDWDVPRSSFSCTESYITIYRRTRIYSFEDCPPWVSSHTSNPHRKSVLTYFTFSTKPKPIYVHVRRLQLNATITVLELQLKALGRLHLLRKIRMSI